MTTVIKGRVPALISSISGFDPANPEKASVSNFSLCHGALDENGNLFPTWTKLGYLHAGFATVEITLMEQSEIANSAVTALREHQTRVMADAQAESTRIEHQIQSLLAISM